MVEYGITSLEKAVRRFADKLEDDGYETEINVFKSGRGNGSEWTSWVELRVDRDDMRLPASAKFLAGGYASYSSTKISTADGIKEAKQQFMERVEKQHDRNR